jgi:hypothetical protein
MTSEEVEDFLREFEILPRQSFLEFHDCIAESVNLFECDEASFFTADKRFKRLREISMNPASRQIKQYDRELDEMVSETVSLPLMKDSQVKNFIEDPHQRFIYECAGNLEGKFLLELFKITESDGNGYLPRCIRSRGELPKQTELPPPVEVIPEEQDEATEPKPLVTLIDKLEKLDDIEEDESEIAEIESNLDEFLKEKHPIPPRISIKKKDNQPAEDDNPEKQPEEIEPALDALTDIFDPTEDTEEDRVEHIGDFDDLESLEMKYTGYRDEPDDE